VTVDVWAYTNIPARVTAEASATVGRLQHLLILVGTGGFSSDLKLPGHLRSKRFFEINVFKHTLPMNNTVQLIASGEN
jgi:hypothetical protein